MKNTKLNLPSPQMCATLATATLAAPHGVPVLITGESGVGKEVVARELHRQSGRTGPFLAVNCAALPATLAEAELFGAAAGAYTDCRTGRPGLFEQADKGTLLLDELAEMDPLLQTKLLRVLQTGEVRPVGGTRLLRPDTRVLAATNRPIDEALRSGRLREDLYHRLAVITVHVPPLRERREDIEPLAEHFLRRWGGPRPLELGASARQYLAAATFPGNVRELESAVHRAIILHPGVTVLEAVHFSADLGSARERAALCGRVACPHRQPGCGERICDVRIREVHTECGSVTETARILKVSRGRVYRALNAGRSMNLALENLRVECGADAAGVARLVTEEGARVCHLVRSGAVPGGACLPYLASRKTFPWIIGELEAGRCAMTHHIDDLPPAAVTDAHHYRQLGVMSFLHQPLDAVWVFSLLSARPHTLVPPRQLPNVRQLLAN